MFGLLLNTHENPMFSLYHSDVLFNDLITFRSYKLTSVCIETNICHRLNVKVDLLSSILTNFFIQRIVQRIDHNIYTKIDTNKYDDINANTD